MNAKHDFTTVVQQADSIRRPARARPLASLLACLLAGVMVLGAADAAAQAQPQSQSQSSAGAQRIRAVDSIAAVVNNEVITNREIDERIALVERRMRTQGTAMPPKTEFRKQLLERMILDRAQMQLARETGIAVDDLLLDRAVATIAEQNRMSMQEFRNQLERDGIPFARFREEIREEITLQRLREREVDNKIQISESEVDNFMSANPGVTAPPEINVAQILIRIPENATAEQIGVRRQRAEEAVQQLRSGAEFAKLAASYSDASDALRGGEIGWRSQDRLPELFVEALSKSAVGDVAAIKSANGFHILKLLGRRDGKQESKVAVAPVVQQTRARHILIKVNQVVSAAEARRKLTEVKQRLDNKAAKFEELARLFSNDVTASRGGDLGWVYPGDLVPEFERAMNALKLGEVSEPVETQFGLHLIEVLERKRDDVSKERQKLAARQALRERKIEEANEEWLRQLRDRVYVEYRAQEAETR